MNEENKNTIIVDAMSSYCIRPLSDLVKEAYGEQIPFFECSHGKYLKCWHKAKEGDTVIYSIDQIAICSGSITFIKKKVFKPVWRPDNEVYGVLVDFARTMCHNSFDKNWHDRMIHQHSVAIKRKQWLFVTFVVIQPTLFYVHNRELLLEKAKMMDEAEDKVEIFGIMPTVD